MLKKFIITEEEKINIKKLYKISEQSDEFTSSVDNAVKKMFGLGGDVNITSNKTTSDDGFYKSVLNCVGAEPTKDNMLFMYAWRQSEGGTSSNNPFNTTQEMSGSVKVSGNSAGVKHYQSSEDGIEATCKTLMNGRYDDIVNGLRNNVGLYKLSRMNGLNIWGTGDLITKVADGYLNGNEPKPKPIS